MKRLIALWALLAVTTAAAAPAPLAAEIPQWRAVLLPGSQNARHDDAPARIRISHRGRVVLDRSLPSDTAMYHPDTVRFSDVAESGHVLVWADVVIQGRDTSRVTVLYDFAPGSPKPHVTSYDWGIFGYEERKDDGKIVFVTSDTTFYALFDARVFSVVPILVRAYRSGTFVDVTTAHPRLVAAQSAEYRSGFQAGVCESSEALGAYLADMVRLGEAEQGVADVTALLFPGGDKQFFQIMNTVLHAKKLIPSTQLLSAAPGVPRCDPNKKRAESEAPPAR